MLQEGSSRGQPACYREVLCSGEQRQLSALSSIHSDEKEIRLIKPFTFAWERFLKTDAFSISKNLIFHSYSN